MPKLIYTGRGNSYTYKGYRFYRDPLTAREHGADEEGAVEVADEADVEYLIGTRQFSHARGKKAAKNERMTFGGKTKAAAPAEGDALPVAFPANGFRDKRSLQAYAREHLGYEADLNKALKTLNAEASAKYEDKFVKPAQAAADERPSDLGMDDDFDDLENADDEIDTAGVVDRTQVQSLDDDNDDDLDDKADEPSEDKPAETPAA